PGKTAESAGGGVSVHDGGTFTLEGGSITGNTAESTHGGGGGVYVRNDGTFTKSGDSTIDDTNSALSGKVAFVYINGNTMKVRNATAGPNIDLDSSKDGDAGGWE
ncbi:MAG: hypothetical protein LBP43_01645, partial [Treponema sp.]|nr:hypothetical protein [Treponema sp.]